MTTHDIKTKIENAVDKVAAVAHKVGDKLHDVAAKSGEKASAAEQTLSSEAKKAGHTLAECTVKGCTAIHRAADHVSQGAQELASKAEAKGRELENKAAAATKQS
jgi:hypothetical protein